MNKKLSKHMKIAAPLLVLAILAHAIPGSATAADPMPNALESFLNAAFQIKKGMPEGDARAILERHGFPVPVPEGSGQVTSVSVGNSFHWTSLFRLSESGRFSLHLDCSTTQAGPDHRHLHGIVERIRIVCDDGRTIELPD